MFIVVFCVKTGVRSAIAYFRSCRVSFRRRRSCVNDKTRSFARTMRFPTTSRILQNGHGRSTHSSWTPSRSAKLVSTRCAVRQPFGMGGRFTRHRVGAIGRRTRSPRSSSKQRCKRATGSKRRTRN